MKKSYDGTIKTAEIKVRPGQTYTEYLLHNLIEFPVDSNHSVTFHAECKIKRPIKFVLMKNYNNPWVSPSGFFDMGIISPRAAATTWTESLYNYVIGQPPVVIEFTNNTLHHCVRGNVCSLVVFDIDGLKDCPFTEIKWTLDITPNKLNEIFL